MKLSKPSKDRVLITIFRGEEAGHVQVEDSSTWKAAVRKLKEDEEVHQLTIEQFDKLTGIRVEYANWQRPPGTGVLIV